MIATVDATAIGELVQQIEHSAHRRGWDAPPGFYVIYDATDVETDRHYRALLPPQRRTGEWPIRRLPYIARQVFSPRMLLPKPPHALFRLALNLSHPEQPKTQELITNMRQPGFVGIALRVEAWMQSAKSRAEIERLNQLRYADLPDSKELRSVEARDVLGGCHLAWRIRGQKPSLVKPTEFSGAVTESLAVIVAAIAGLPLPELCCTPKGWVWPDEDSPDSAGGQDGVSRHVDL